MCVGRYAAKVMRNERSEMEHNRSEMPAKSHNKHASQRDAISPPKGNLMLSHSAGMHNTDIFIAGISKRFHFALLHYIFSAYLPTHIKFLTEFHYKSSSEQYVYQFLFQFPISHTANSSFVKLAHQCRDDCDGGVKKRFARVRKKLYLCIAFREMLPNRSVRDIAQSG